MKKLLIACAFSWLAVAGFAQNYRTGIGLRGGPSTGISFKQFVGAYSALEVMGANRWGGWNITLMYEYHNRLFKVRRGGTGGFDSQRLHYFLGVGGHVGFWKDESGHPWFNGSTNENRTVIGADGIIGLEYAWKRIPLCIAVDYKPGLNIVGTDDKKGFFWADEAALTLRYIF